MKKRIFSWSAVILWCIFIFWNSAKSGLESSQDSIYFLTLAKEAFSKIFGTDIGFTELIIRKLAHVTEYTVLAVLIYNAVQNTPRIQKKYAVTLLLCVIYAISDEIHQYFVPGRACSAVDVLIDSGGAILGIFLVVMAGREWEVLARPKGRF